MRKYLLFFCVLPALAGYAQMKEGRIVYERTVQLPKRFVSDPNLAGQIPKSRTDQFELLFSSNQSLWQYLPSAETEDPGTFVGNGIVLRMGGGANEVSYHELDKGIKIEQRELADKNYVVTDSISKLSWKLTDETKSILNHTVRKAISQRVRQRMMRTMENGEMKIQAVPDTAAVVAWFTTDIPVSTGPDFQGQLPGLILELDIDNGQTLFKATEISPKVNIAKIKAPKDGKKMTAQEFNTEREKVMETMRKNMQGSGNVIRFSN